MAADLKDTIKKAKDSSELAKVRLYQNLTSRITDGDKLNATELKTFNQLDREFSSGESAGSGSDPPEIFNSFGDAVSYLGVSKRTLQVQIKKGNIRQEPDGTFFKTELDNYIGKHNRNEKKNVFTEIEQSIKEADLRYRVAKATREEFMIKQLRGEYLSKKQVHHGWAGRLGVLCSSLENLADRLPPILFKKSRAEMYEVIRNEIDEMRSTLCQGGEYCPQQNRKVGRPRKVKK